MFTINEIMLIVYREISMHCFEGVFTVLKAVNLDMDSRFIGPPSGLGEFKSVPSAGHPDIIHQTA